MELTSGVNPNDIEGALLSRIPHFDDTRKTDYVGYRAMGFNELESARLVKVRPNLINKWTEDDADFASWLSSQGIKKLQTTVAKDLARHQFFRNFHLLLQVHYRVLAKAAKIGDDQSELSEVEIDLLKNFSRNYGASDLLAMLKATSIDETEQKSLREVSPTIQVFLGDQAINDELARRAASRSLLDQFTHQDDVIEGEVIGRG